MTFGYTDSASHWPEGEFMCLIPETETDMETLKHLGMFAIKSGWDALVINGDSDTIKKLFLVPKAAK